MSYRGLSWALPCLAIPFPLRSSMSRYYLLRPMLPSHGLWRTSARRVLWCRGGLLELFSVCHLRGLCASSRGIALCRAGAAALPALLGVLCRLSSTGGIARDRARLIPIAVSPLRSLSYRRAADRADLWLDSWYEFLTNIESADMHAAVELYSLICA